MCQVLLRAVTLAAIAASAVAQDAVTVACQARIQALTEHVPGISAAVVLPDGREVTVVAGYSDRDGDVALTAANRMFSGSIGKTYFAAIAHLLLGKGTLSLDDTVAQHLGEESWFERLPNRDDITIRHLMTHQSGLPRWVYAREFWVQLVEDPDRVWRPGDQLEFILDAKPQHPAGEGWAYSDTNYIVLGLIMERATGETVYDLVREHLLEPHELHDTIAADGRDLPGLSQGENHLFRRFGMPPKVLEGGRLTFNPAFEWCGGGFISTPLDLARWARIYGSGEAVEQDYLDAMVGEAVAAGREVGEDGKYGLGVMVRPSRLGPMLGHDGVFPGFASSMAWFPECRVAVAVQVNTDRPRGGPRLSQLLVDLAEVALGR